MRCPGNVPYTLSQPPPPTRTTKTVNPGQRAARLEELLQQRAEAGRHVGGAGLGDVPPVVAVPIKDEERVGVRLAAHGAQADEEVVLVLLLNGAEAYVLHALRGRDAVEAGRRIIGQQWARSAVVRTAVS